MILHITQRSAWETAVTQGEYRAPSLANEGFIHCSTRQQLLGPAQRFFGGQTGLVVLCITSEKITAPIIYEDLYDHGDTFPHIYGPINLDAVVDVVDFPPNPDGSFSVPPRILQLVL